LSLVPPQNQNLRIGLVCAAHAGAPGRTTIEARAEDGRGHRAFSLAVASGVPERALDGQLPLKLTVGGRCVSCAFYQFLALSSFSQSPFCSLRPFCAAVQLSAALLEYYGLQMLNKGNIPYRLQICIGLSNIRKSLARIRKALKKKG
jgi:hypothetical protein